MSIHVVEVIMFIRYSFNRLSRLERAQLSMVLLEELQFQNWFGIACSNLLKREIVVTIQ